MAIVSLGILTADLDLRGTLEYGPFTHRADRAFIYFLRVVTPGAQLDGAYFNINAAHQQLGSVIRQPLLAKFFPQGTDMAFLVKVPPIFPGANQQVLIQVGPKEFTRGSAFTRQVDLELLWEDNQELRLDDSFPS